MRAVTADRKRRGMTLTSIMVAVALSGVLAVAGVRLVVNQMNAMRIMELIDKGDAIYKFYSNLLHDDKVWWCTLYHDIEGTASTHINKDLRDCVFSVDTTKCTESPLELRGPDCKFHEPLVGTKLKRRFKYVPLQVGGYDFKKDYGGKKQFESSPTLFIPSGGKALKDSVITQAAGGWWNVKLTWKEAGKSGATKRHAVDLIFEQTFDADKWKGVPATGKRYLPALNYPRKLRVRRSANYIKGGSYDCGASAVTAIALHTANRAVSCHTTPLVQTKGNLSNCPNLSPRGQVVKSNTNCSGDRVSVTPTNCALSYSVISRIGAGVTAAVPNVECALKRKGKMVDYNSRCPSSVDDKCTAPGQVFRVTNTKHIALQKISSTGTFNSDQECGTLMGRPTKAAQSLTAPNVSISDAEGQGPIGAKGYSTCGDPGPPGPGCPASWPSGHWTWKHDNRACPSP